MSFLGKEGLRRLGIVDLGKIRQDATRVLDAKVRDNAVSKKYPKAGPVLLWKDEADALREEVVNPGAFKLPKVVLIALSLVDSTRYGEVKHVQTDLEKKLRQKGIIR